MSLWVFQDTERRWYTHLISNDQQKGLLDNYELSSSNIIICYEDCKNIRRYAVFNTYIDFLIRLINRPEDDRCFHEVILGDRMLKLFFDIDISHDKFDIFDEQKMFSELTVAILSYFKSDNITLDLGRDFIWLNSSSESKKSYHLIIDNYCFSNMKEVGYAVDQIRSLISPVVQSYFDWGIYISKKNFRTLESIKRGTARILKFMTTWYVTINGVTRQINYKYNEDDDPSDEGISRKQLMLQMEASLISNVDHCYPMISKIQVTDSTNKTDEQVLPEIVNRAYNLMPDSSCFSIQDVRGNFIILKRLISSICPICNIAHEHENPYLRVVNTKISSEIYFHCRRSTQKKGFKLGDIPKVFHPSVIDEAMINEKSYELLKDRSKIASVRRDARVLSERSEMSKRKLCDKAQIQVGKRT